MTMSAAIMILPVMMMLMIGGPVLSSQCVDWYRTPQCVAVFAGYVECSPGEARCVIARPPIWRVRCKTPMQVRDPEGSLQLLGQCIDDTVIDEKQKDEMAVVTLSNPDLRMEAKYPNHQDCQCPERESESLKVFSKVVSALVGILLTLLTLYIRYRVKRVQKGRRRRHQLEETPKMMLGKML